MRDPEERIGCIQLRADEAWPRRPRRTIPGKTEGRRVERNADGHRGVGFDSRRCGEEAELERVMMMGADFYEDEEDLQYNRELGIPDIGIGKGSVIRSAIIDKNAHIGENVRIINEERLQNFDGPGYYIRDGIVIVPKNGVLPVGTVI